MKYFIILLALISCIGCTSVPLYQKQYQRQEQYLDCSDEVSCISAGQQYCQKKKMGLERIIKEEDKFKVRCKERLIQRK